MVSDYRRRRGYSLNINKEKLAKLQGLNPCTSPVTFVPSAYDEFKDDKSMKDLLPSFTCKMMSNEQVEQVKGLMVRLANQEKGTSDIDKKSEIVSIISDNITGWSKMYDLSTGKEIVYGSDMVGNLTENVLDSILVELSKYAGFIPR